MRQDVRMVMPLQESENPTFKCRMSIPNYMLEIVKAFSTTENHLPRNEKWESTLIKAMDVKNMAES